MGTSDTSQNCLPSPVRVALERKTEAEQLGWGELGMGHHKGRTHDTRYIPLMSLNTVTWDRSFHSSLIRAEMAMNLMCRHLHQDLAVTLELYREGDMWLAMNEGYVQVAAPQSRRSQAVLARFAPNTRNIICVREVLRSIYRRTARAVKSWRTGPRSRGPAARNRAWSAVDGKGGCGRFTKEGNPSVRSGSSSVYANKCRQG